MNIGIKLKNARNAKGMSQEETAEELGISRQTLSNWENEKTYPDVISVIKMSDLYGVSLDLLLKGEESGGYMDYLESSTNTVKSTRRRTGAMLLSVYLFVWTLGIIAFWFIMSPGDAFGYSITYLGIVLPGVTFAVSLFIRKSGLRVSVAVMLVLCLGIMYMLAEYATFSAANMVSFSKMNAPRFEYIPIGVSVSLLGIAVSWLLDRKKTAKEPKTNG